MEDKYLPIGSIVTINATNKKIMIAGYYSIKYQNNVRIYDYVGYSYPEGILLPNSYSFNHSDIISVDFVGYKDEAYEVLNKNMLGQQNNTNDDLKTNNNFVNLKYDNNGVVIYDAVDFSNFKVDPKINELLDSIEIKNPFTKSVDLETSGVEPTIASKNANDTLKDELTLPTYHFDDNGIIVTE